MKMKTGTTLAALAVAFAAISSQLSTARAQGSLTPPGAPAPTMKTLTQIEPRIPISSLPITIISPGSYYFTTNLISSGTSHGITISSGNVTVDLNGFVLQGVHSGAWSGIYVTASYTNLVFRNGSVAGWGGNGIDTYSAAYPRNQLFEHLTVSDNGGNGIYSEAGSIIRDCIAYGNSGNGFYSQGGEISGCLSRNNGNTGFAPNFCSLFHCSAEFNAGHGFSLNYSRALDCDSLSNTNHGFDCTGTGDEIRRCRISNNNNNGVTCETSTGGTVIEDCEIANNAGYGIYTYAGGSGGAHIARNNLNLNVIAGMGLYDYNNCVEDNHILTSNGSYGINAGTGSTNNVVIKNVVTGSGIYNYRDAGSGNDFGPIGSASSATSPWANISL